MRVFLTLSVCPLSDAEWILVGQIDRSKHLVRVSRVPSISSINLQSQADGFFQGMPEASGPSFVANGFGCERILDFRCQRYVYSPESNSFLSVPAMPATLTKDIDAALSLRVGYPGQVIDDWERTERRLLHGSNELRIPIKPAMLLLAEEMVHPFYVFQYVSVLIWCLEAYYSYSAIILAITFFSISMTVNQTHRYRKRLADLAHFSCPVHVPQTGGSPSTCNSSELVPGDVVIVQPGILPCDIVLLQGEAIVDENMLTGEAVPVRKVSYQPNATKASSMSLPRLAQFGHDYNPDVHKSSTLFGGTTVEQVRSSGRGQVLGLVVRTGFSTAKGQLLKSILFPKQPKQTFMTDSLGFIGFMLILGVAFYVWDIVALVSYGAPAGFIVLRYFDLITVAVPPALPACLTVATALAITRLMHQGIYVSNPSAINAAGHLDIICFDKTGTLTESGLDLYGIVPNLRHLPHNREEVLSDNGLATRPQIGMGSTIVPSTVCGPLWMPNGVDTHHSHQLPFVLLEVLATCHGLAQLNGDLVGDPLDKSLFTASGWNLLEDEHDHDHDHEHEHEHENEHENENDRERYGQVGKRRQVEILAWPEENDEVASTRVESDLEAELDGEGRLLDGEEVSQGEDVPEKALHLAISPKHRIPGSTGVFAFAQLRTRVRPRSCSQDDPATVIVRRIEFSSETQRNLVVVGRPDGSMHVHAKGSPESILGLCEPDSIPVDVHDELDKYTRVGMRVLALATRRLLSTESLSTAINPLSISPPGAIFSMNQDELEAGLQFLGLVIMVNPLKPDTVDALKQLEDAGIRNIMVTGDHTRTAVSVARQCNILSHELNLPVVCIDSHRPNANHRFTNVISNSNGNQCRALDVSLFKVQGSNAEHTDSNLMDGDSPVQDGATLNAPNRGIIPFLHGIMNGLYEVAVTGRGFQALLTTDSCPTMSNHVANEDAAVPFEGSFERGVGNTGGGLDTVLSKAGVFARMSPDDKRELVELLGTGTLPQSQAGSPGLGHYVGFCGDGANDVGALKAAHVGVSLCEAEASVAAPLTSRKQSIKCMVTVVAEGRCSLEASYLIFKFVIVYAFVQVFGVSLMYSYGGSVGNYQYLIQDLLYTTAIAGTMGFTQPATRLTSSRPPERLMSTAIWVPVIVQFLSCAGFQLLSLLLLSREPWYVRFDPSHHEPESQDFPSATCFSRSTANSPQCSRSWENSTVFLMSLGQFIITALVFNRGPPHRKRIYTNSWLMAVLVVQTAFLLYLIFTPGDVVSREFAGMIAFPIATFRWKLFALLVINYICAWLADRIALLFYKID